MRIVAEDQLSVVSYISMKIHRTIEYFLCHCASDNKGSSLCQPVSTRVQWQLCKCRCSRPDWGYLVQLLCCDRFMLTDWGLEKMTVICRHFQMCFLGWELFYFNSNVTDTYSQVVVAYMRHSESASNEYVTGGQFNRQFHPMSVLSITIFP